MIKTFRHKGLQKFFDNGIRAGLQQNHVRRLGLILGMLNAASEPKDMAAPGLNLHELKGRRKGTYSVTVNGNWRLTFKMDDGDVFDVNYEDYH